MERVQFQQEQMLSELKDLVQKGLFTQKEAKQIMQKRTAFETALVRRIPKKSDFLRYATYEMGLEALRRKRAERLKIEKGPPSVSDYALVRRQFQIFERALKKFKGDVGLWIQYIQVAKKEGARSLVGRITARALQLHPNVPSLYVLAASHELDHLSPSAARTLLQRGLRLNADSVEMWREYVRMELGFVESLRRRWSVLGIDVKGKGKDTDMGTRKSVETGADAEDLWAGLGEESLQPAGGADGMDVDSEEVEADEAARREIMQGAIVKSVISSAVKAIPKVELFTSLHELISAYPSPPPLRESLLDHLHAHLRETLPSHPDAIKLSATRRLTPNLVGEPFVEALKIANEQLSANVRTAVGDAKPGVSSVYAEFLQEWCGKDLDETLKAYLITSLHLLILQLPSPVPPALLAAHIRLLVSHHAPLGSVLLPPKVNTPDKILRAARKHTGRSPTSATVWLARLDAERQFAEKEEVQRAWEEARKQVHGDGVQDIWLWGLAPYPRPSPPTVPRGPSAADPEGPDSDADVQLVEHLLHESRLIRDPAQAGAVHEVLLIRYAAATHRALLAHHARPAQTPTRPQRTSAPDKADVEARLARVRRIATAYKPSARVWAAVFAQETHAPDAGGEEDEGDAEEEAAAGDAAGAAGVAAPGAPGGASGAGYFGDASVVRAVYEQWRRCDGVEATTGWATWLLRRGEGREAIAVVARARSALGDADGLEVERRWKTVLDGQA